MKKIVGFILFISLFFESYSQVDTSYVYSTSKPYGTLDIRIRKSSTRYYYLKPDVTFSFRESSPGVKTNTYRDITSWDSSPYSQGHMREKNGSLDAFIMNYRLLFPQGYNASYDPGYPMIVMMHGAGERGNCWDNTCYHGDRTWTPATNSPAAPTDPTSRLLNNDHNLLHGGSPHLNARNAAGTKLPNDPTLSARAFPGFVLFPQNMNGWSSTSVQDAIRLVRLVAQKYNVDEDRIYIHGLSNGGYAVYETIKRAPWLFAAALMMSAASDASVTSNSAVTASVAHIPMWMFQGGQDAAPTPAKTEGYVRRLREAGAVARYSLYPHLGHGTWNTAYNEGDFFSWIRSQNKSKIHTFAGGTSICLSNGDGVKMELAAGFRAYQWEKNGVIISGATDNTYTATTTGTYRARFSRKPNPTASDWNQWSPAINITQQNPPKPDLDQIGTVVLKDPNGGNDARLLANEGYDKYYWYKNGVKLSISDTTNAPVIKSTSGNGAYTLVVLGFDNCPSPASNPKYIFFTDSAPINITSPSGLAGSLPSSSSVRLTWNDASSNEAGFEVWRRKVISGTTYTKWEMRTLTAANVETFTDTGVEPSSTYHYKIRAVSNTGRSNYNPTTQLVINTSGDGTPPSIPQNVKATATGINTITLTWSASTDNSGIKQYRIYYGTETVLTGSNKTSHVLSNLTLNKVYTFTVKAEDLGGNLSGSSASATANTYVSGLYYEHSTGAWTDLDNINWSNPEFTGKVTTFSIAPRTQEDFFYFKYDGYLYINTGGTYQFQTTSSDGSRIELDGALIVNNDGVHASRTITNTNVPLSAGPRRITVKYFEYDESHVLTVRYKGPDTGGSWVVIPSTALKSGNAPTSTDTQMAGGGEAESLMTESALTVFPNPTSPSNINVMMDSPGPEPVQIQMIDFSGRTIYQGEFIPERVNEGVTITPSESLLDGLYLLRVNQNGRTIQKRVSIKN
jgi:hypothetical protein